MVYRRIIDSNVNNDKILNSDIFKLHQMLLKENIQHDFIECHESDQWLQLIYPSIEDWKNVERMDPKDSCCSIIQSSFDEDAPLELMGLLTDEEKEMYHSDAVFLQTDVNDIFDRIARAEMIRLLEFRHFAVNRAKEENSSDYYFTKGW